MKNFQVLKFVFIVVLGVISLSIQAQEDLYLKNGNKNSTLKAGRNVVPILKNGYQPTQLWTNVCQSELQFSADSLWVFKGVQPDESLVFVRASAYKIRTFSNEEFRKLPRETRRDYKKNWTQHHTRTYKQAHRHDTLKVKLNEIESFRFARAKKCNPNVNTAIGLLTFASGFAVTYSLIGLGVSTGTLAVSAAAVMVILVSVDVLQSYKVKEYRLAEWEVDVQ